MCILRLQQSNANRVRNHSADHLLSKYNGTKAKVKPVSENYTLDINNLKGLLSSLEQENEVYKL